ncbi:unnamed protein product [Tetraodon nigroviridis]|uniref:(spotted green pufferfish) hypothetical protein n=1 Tax=Tetraodon nigroviridis TaxID=99883 RepID=Q4TEM4_TETNG|nr:unnamed protein product [Tetraodon nigroviridis]
MVVRRKIPTSAVVSSMFPFRETRTQKRAAVGRGGWRPGLETLQMGGFQDQQVPLCNSRNLQISCRRPADDRRRKLIKSEWRWTPKICSRTSDNCRKLGWQQVRVKSKTV